MAERFEATYRDISELHFAAIGAYVADCFVAASRLPRWGEEYEARSIRTSPGGKALNQAVALARLGAHVSAIGAVGEDGLGRDIMSALNRQGIETEFFITCEKAATSICICFVGDNGQTSFVWHIDEDVAVTPEIVRAAKPALRRADAVLVTIRGPCAYDPGSPEACSPLCRTGLSPARAPSGEPESGSDATLGKRRCSRSQRSRSPRDSRRCWS